MATKKITDLQLISSITGSENFPVDDGIETYRATPLQIYNYLKTKFAPNTDELSNLELAVSVGSSALTIAVKTLAGTDPSSTDPVRVSFRSATQTSGAYVSRSITSALSVVVSSGSTLGHISGLTHYIYVYLIDNAGTPELAVSTVAYDQGTVLSTTSEGGAGAANSNRIVYSTTARSNVASRLIGRLKSSQTTAGTWATAPSEVSLWPFSIFKISCRYNTSTADSATGGAAFGYSTREHDTHNAYASSTGAFTAPKTAKYLLTAKMYTNSAQSLVSRNNGTNSSQGTSGASGVVATLTDILSVTAGQTIDIITNSSGTTAASVPYLNNVEITEM